ncbi:hypothetical protein ASPWEDRAFT_170372 [Aspergillus wentii DTO 134E9]|uniref:SWIM-type domain-containing protein n=1 Tax=Aspergillus wentii DTO 134E9 TaxID=1073089 RepID=A0A1L9RPJ2_ASPWE|nr:uncharacterized protein ASPWEDRAFT_170372 [Aspergillus wentii DTO 134E9]KAI9924090.1 hypothetical protein MW887_007329 [Aspergillus wentii]OJJ36866.1 hypothetical protein ASPWEDRAFT_170372 [Aspergillus wentii DTO 134E9]
MSAPTRQFRRLSIGGNLPDTRSQADRAPHSTSHGPSSGGSDNESFESSEEEGESEEGDSAESSTVQATSGITYDLAHLDGDSVARALVGLTGRFEVINCRTTGRGYSFQLSEQPQVTISPDTYSCTCFTFQNRPDVACQHIFWIVDQLRGCLTPHPPSSDVPLTNDGRSPEFTRIEQLLEGQLETVADQLGCQYTRCEADGGMNRPQNVRDIMSAFSPVTLPEEFRLDLVEDPEQSRTPEQCVVQGDFEATMFRLAVHDDVVYNSLCKAMPPGACAAIYFDKIQEKTRRLLADFDRYCQTGQAPTDGTSVEVGDVVEHLQQNVDRVQANIIARAPHGMEGAAKALVTLLEDVCNRNKDALDGNRWGRASFQGEDEDQRNLYQQLIGKAEETEEFFVLDALEHLPPGDLSQFGSRMRAMLHRNEVNRAPKAYIIKLSALVRLAESTSTGSGQKRPAAGTPGGNSKRTR